MFFNVQTKKENAEAILLAICKPMERLGELLVGSGAIDCLHPSYHVLLTRIIVSRYWMFALESTGSGVDSATHILSAWRQNRSSKDVVELLH